MESLTFLERASKAKPAPVYALAGDEDFLKRQVLAALKLLVLGGDDDGFGLASYAGDRAEFASVRDELETLPFLGSRRLVVIDNADPFVTRYRALLEKYVEKPAGNGTLVLDVKTWPANTRLAKALGEAGTLTCKAPAAYKLPPWCVQWTASRHEKQLTSPAAQLLVELIGPEMGQLDQELTKLAVYVGDKKRIDVADVDALVGRSQAAETFKIFAALGAGKIDEALTILDRLMEQGQEPLAVLGAFSWQLRKLAQAARLCEHGKSVDAALREVGVPPFAVKGSEEQLRHLGRRRAGRLYDWLLETDLGLKGSSLLPPRLLLERLIVRLGRPREGQITIWRAGGVRPPASS